MNHYIKANPKVVKFLSLQDDREKLSDGNYILWQGDLIKIDTLNNIAKILEDIGGISLSEEEAIEEIGGEKMRRLPVPKDSRFK